MGQKGGYCYGHTDGDVTLWPFPQLHTLYPPFIENHSAFHTLHLFLNTNKIPICLPLWTLLIDWLDWIGLDWSEFNSIQFNSKWIDRPSELMIDQIDNRLIYWLLSDICSNIEMRITTEDGRDERPLIQISQQQTKQASFNLRDVLPGKYKGNFEKEKGYFYHC